MQLSDRATRTLVAVVAPILVVSAVKATPPFSLVWFSGAIILLCREFTVTGGVAIVLSEVENKEEVGARL